MRRKSFTEMARSREEEMELERIHGREQAKTGFWGAQGAGSLFMARDTGRILFSFRSAEVNEGHTWGTYGGAIDPGESPAAAAMREAEEEAGYDAKASDIIPLYVFQSGSFKFSNFLILTPSEFEPRPYEGIEAYYSDPVGNWESEDFVWTTFGNWPEPLHFGAEALLSDEKSLAILQKLAQQFGGQRRAVGEAAQTLYHSTPDDIEEFRPLTHFGSAIAAKRRHMKQKGVVQPGMKGRAGKKGEKLKTYEIPMQFKSPAYMIDTGVQHNVMEIASGLMDGARTEQGQKLNKFSYEELEKLWGLIDSYWMDLEDDMEYFLMMKKFKNEAEAIAAFDKKWGPKLVEFLTSHGHDSIVYINTKEHKGTKSYINLHPIRGAA